MAREQGDLTVLIVDDHEDTVNSLKWFLEYEGLVVDYAQTTKEGLRRLGDKNYDLVITDLNQTPTGVDVYRAATKKGMKARIITGDASDSLTEEAKKVAGEDLIMKPNIFDPILNLVDRLKAEKQK